MTEKTARVLFLSVVLLGIFSYNAYHTPRRWEYTLNTISTNDNLPEKIIQHENPPPPRLLKTSGAMYPDSYGVYTLILDEANEPKPYQCKVKKLWLDNFTSEPMSDGFELYSLYSYQNKNCSIHTIQVKPPTRKLYNPSSYLLHEALKMYLQRSTAAWVFLITDGSYVRVDKLRRIVSEMSKQRFPMYDWLITGGCIERRYFFQMLSPNSGILISRAMVKQILSTQWKWEISINLSLPAEESLSQIIDTASGFHIPHIHHQYMVGATWALPEHRDYLMQKDFSKLEKCFIPEKIKSPAPGDNGICTHDILPLKNIISWGGGGIDGKEDFLDNVEFMLQDLPDDVGYFWYKLNPFLCKIVPPEPKNETIAEEKPKNETPKEEATHNEESEKK